MEFAILLLLPVLASCSITIEIQASKTIASSRVDIAGTDSNIISDEEQITFGVTEETLKIAAEKHSGGRPQDVFLHSPTPWNDLYQTYGWSPVKRVLKPIRSKILHVTLEQGAINVKEMNNNSTATVIFNAVVAVDVENAVTNTWIKGGALSVKDPIFYDINYTNGSVAGTNFKYTSAWGKNAMEVKKVTIGTHSDMQVPIEPGKSFKAELLATKVTMIVEIDYSASLNGHVACNYPKKYNGHHFWRYDMSALQDAAKLDKTVKSSEVIKIKYYSNPKMVITNKDTREMVSTHPGLIREGI